MFEEYGVGGYAKPSLKSDTTITDGTQISLTTAYTTSSQQWNTNPADGQPWEWSDIDALQIGISLLSAYCSQVYVEVNYTVIVAPTVTTQAATSVAYTTATGNGNITNTGGENCTIRGFKYGLTQTDTWSVSDSGSFGTGAYTKGLTGLSNNTTYYIRAFATNSAGTGYGSYVSFTTLSADITNAPTDKAFGNVAENSTYWANGSTPPNPITDAYCTFSVTNNGTTPINITIKATNFTGGAGWTLGTPDATHARLTGFKSGDDPSAGVVLTTSEQSFISALAASSSKKWEIKLETPTSFADGSVKTSTITLTAVAT